MSKSHTCIAACVTESTLWMGADSNTYGWNHNLQSDKSKIVRHKVETDNGEQPILMGVTGHVRVVNLLRYAIDIPERDGPLRPWLVNDLIAEIRSTFQDRGLVDDDNGREWFEGSILVGVEGELFHIGSGFDLVPIADNYSSVGSGAQYALGVLSNAAMGRGSVELALQAAAKHDPYVNPPFTFETIEDNK